MLNSGCCWVDLVDKIFPRLHPCISPVAPEGSLLRPALLTALLFGFHGNIGLQHLTQPPPVLSWAAAGPWASRAEHPSLPLWPRFQLWASPGRLSHVVMPMGDWEQKAQAVQACSLSLLRSRRWPSSSHSKAILQQVYLHCFETGITSMLPCSMC